MVTTDFFYHRLPYILNEIQEKYDVTVDKAYEIWVTYILGNLQSYDKAYGYCIGGKGDKGVDSFIPEVNNDETIRIIQAKYHHDLGAKEVRNTLLELKNTIKWLEDENLNGKVYNRDFINRSILYRKLMKKNYKIILILATVGRLAPDAKQELEKINEEFNRTKGNVIMKVYDIDELKDLYERRALIEGLQQLKGPVNINIIKEEAFIRSREESVKTIVGTIKGQELVRIYDNYKHKLFNSNIRYYKGEKTEASQNMITTSTDPIECRRFFNYNNGITIVCDSFECSTDNANKILDDTIIAMNPQICNGCQTTCTLAKIAEITDLDCLAEIDILVKIIGTRDKQIAANICKNTNTQNNTSKQDLRTNDEVQEKLKYEFSNLQIGGQLKPFYYERKSGEKSIIKDLNKTEEARYKWKFNNEPKATIKTINMKDLAKAYMSFIGRPGTARSNPGKLFDIQDANYEKIFNDNITAEEYLLPTIILKKVEKKIKSSTKELNDIIDDDNVNDAEKRIAQQLLPIKYASTYCVAMFGYIFKTKYGSLPGMNESSKILDCIFKSDDIFDNMYSHCEKAIRGFVKSNGLDKDFSNLFKENKTLESLLKELEEQIAISKDRLDYIP